MILPSYGLCLVAQRLEIQPRLHTTTLDQISQSSTVPAIVKLTALQSYVLHSSFVHPPCIIVPFSTGPRRLSSYSFHSSGISANLTSFSPNVTSSFSVLLRYPSNCNPFAVKDTFHQELHEVSHAARRDEIVISAGET